MHGKEYQGFKVSDSVGKMTFSIGKVRIVLISWFYVILHQML